MYVFAFIFFFNSFISAFQTSDEEQKLYDAQNFSSSELRNRIFYLENNSINSESELKTINKIQNGVERDLLKSVIYKKEGDFKKQFEILFSHLKSYPRDLFFYDELIYSANASNNLGKAEKFLKDNLKSENSYIIYFRALYNYATGNIKNALNDFQTASTQLKFPDVYYQLSYAQRAAGYYDKAFQTLQKGKSLLAKNDFDLPKFTIAQGSLLYLSGRIKEAKQFFETGLKEAEASKNNIEKIKSLVNIGIILDDEGNVYAARDYFTNAINHSDKINSIELSAFSNSEMGVSFSLTNELADAQKYYKTSFDLYKRINDKQRLAYLSRNIGNIRINFADYNSALTYFNEGIKYSGENKRALIQNYTGIADVYHNLANYSKALEYYELSKILAEEIKDVDLQADVYSGFGVLYFNLDKPEKALKYFKIAEELFSNTGNLFGQTLIYHKLGITYSELNDFQSAEKYLNSSIKTAKETGDIKNELTAYTDLAFLYYLRNENEKAFALLQKIIPAAKKYELFELLSLQEIISGDIYLRKKNINYAINNYKEAVKEAKKIFNRDLQIEAYFKLAKIYRSLNNFIEAEKYFLNSVKLVDNISGSLSNNSQIQISYFANYIDIFDSLTDFYISQKRNKDAFLIAEQSRSRNTFQNLTNIKLNSILNDKAALEKLYELEWMLNSGIYEDEEIDSIKNLRSNLIQQISSQNPAAVKYLNGIGNISIEKFQESLGKKENFVSIFVSGNYSQYFLITKSKFVSGRINITRDSLLQLIYNISPYYNPNYDDSEIYFNQDLFSLNAEATYNLYKKIFSEIITKIPRNETIIFNLPPELSAVPLELLVTEYKDFYSAYNYGNKNFLVYNYNISYSPSFKIYLEQKKHGARNNKSVLLVGDPYLENTPNLYAARRGLLDDRDLFTRLSALYPLEFSREEVNEIDALTGDAVLLLSEDATESNFKKNAADKNIIHLSTHSFQYKNQPLIVFSGINDKQNDGLLEAEEIIKLNLNSDLVVLSSCRSGLGEIDKAEGIIGMQKAFYEAGAKSLVVSLWDVSDKYTAKFMAEFYKQLREGKTKSEALRYAKINFIKNYSANPYYWSAFVLYGNDSPVRLEQTSGKFYLMVFISGGIIIFLTIFFYRRRILIQNS
ncbi:MAG: CHAT domain-containing protein [Melioribacteraceae bacterium]|nr:MAG: CHAT domain-containing protein [Melioribacteraceae bacterium]